MSLKTNLSELIVDAISKIEILHDIAHVSIVRPCGDTIGIVVACDFPDRYSKKDAEEASNQIGSMVLKIIDNFTQAEIVNFSEVEVHIAQSHFKRVTVINKKI